MVSLKGFWFLSDLPMESLMQFAGRTMYHRHCLCTPCKTQRSWHCLCICCMQTSCRGRFGFAEQRWAEGSGASREDAESVSICSVQQQSCSFWIICVKIRPEQSILWRTTALMRKPLSVLIRPFGSLCVPKCLSSSWRAMAVKHVGLQL